MKVHWYQKQTTEEIEMNPPSSKKDWHLGDVVVTKDGKYIVDENRDLLTPEGYIEAVLASEWGEADE